MVLQDTWIFDGTILDNIKYTKPNASKEEIEMLNKYRALSDKEKEAVKSMIAALYKK